MYVGLDWIYERGRALARRLHDALAAADGVELITPADALATMVVFHVSAWPVEAALAELRRRVFAILGTTDGGAALRASVAWFNSEEEIDRFCGAVAEIARYTPESLPRRPQLSVVH
jgi:selenocysteine lyase/cysteine desulfurase